MVADEITKMALSEEGSTSMELNMEVQKRPSIEEVPTFVIQSTNSWMTLIVSFLQDGRLPQDSHRTPRRLRRSRRGQPDLQS